MNSKELAKKAKQIVKNANSKEIADLSVEAIAERLQVCQPQLSKAFSEHFYCDLGTALLYKRIETFDYLIIHNETSTLTQTLDHLNINNDSHFITQYRNVKGHTPGYFIKLMKRFRKRTLHKTQQVLKVFRKKNKKSKKKCENAVLIIPENAENEGNKSNSKKSRSQKRKPTIDMVINPS